MGTLDGRTALVTGGGRGVGQGIALALAGEGAKVAVLGRSPGPLEATCTLVRERGGRAEPVPCDVSETAAVPGAVERAAALLGPVDILVNNAYSGAYGRLETLDDADLRRGFDSGPFAAFAFMKACRPHMLERGGGHVVNVISSAVARWDPSSYGAYAAAKQALRSLSRTAAAEWGRDGIRVNAIAPLALSPGLRGWAERNPEEAEEFISSVPLGYLGDCEEDIGRAVAMLTGPDARYLTGATLGLDGGQAPFG
ncbi:SDR family oxidoreductase [Nocardiopsis sp. HNM0947]|uniref:SDR family oxidoreductase n=1 Tax=Nocardiopsis coralli TaxID=2772213 RepID=A0ABR9PEV9_9ACTN|nr:SDR family oxidoreductase [Nocardiopsis coralli]MBE3002384.1 SDR family oxidoreductase [Nocardiopsis coralli]